eukprot:scaffold187665_cov19-Prasinocladus_malaysianus.AAC.1
MSPDLGNSSSAFQVGSPGTGSFQSSATVSLEPAGSLSAAASMHEASEGHAQPGQEGSARGDFKAPEEVWPEQSRCLCRRQPGMMADLSGQIAQWAWRQAHS